MEHFKHILFLDIETVPAEQDYSLLPEALQKEWTKKAKYLKGKEEIELLPDALYAERAGIFSEFAKVVCIGFGSFHLHEDGWKMRLKTLTNDNEKVLLNDFCSLLGKFKEHFPNMIFCGHNIKEFDIPFLCRRMVINGIQLPEAMQLSAKKPWEVSHLDTLELWRFGDHKHYTSLALLAAVLDIPSPKDDIDGSMVARVYWQERDLHRIGKYCMQDVLTAAKVFLKLKGETDISPEPIYVYE